MRPCVFTYKRPGQQRLQKQSQPLNKLKSLESVQHTVSGQRMTSLLLSKQQNKKAKRYERLEASVSQSESLTAVGRSLELNTRRATPHRNVL